MIDFYSWWHFYFYGVGSPWAKCCTLPTLHFRGHRWCTHSSSGTTISTSYHRYFRCKCRSTYQWFLESHVFIFTSESSCYLRRAGLVQWWELSHWVIRSWVRSSLSADFAGGRLASVFPFPRPHSCGSLRHWVCPMFLLGAVRWVLLLNRNNFVFIQISIICSFSTVYC